MYHKAHVSVPIYSPAIAHLYMTKINNTITLHGFADDHSSHKNFKADNKDQEQQTKTDLEEAFKQ